MKSARSHHQDKYQTQLHRFEHPAMATVYEILIYHEEAEYARQAAYAAFEEIDRLERMLSRFIENSDISRINRLSGGQSVRVGPDAFACLRQCQQHYRDSNGAFDVTTGFLLNCWMNKDKTPRQPSQEELEKARERTGMKHLELNEAEFTVTVLNEAVRIDLGAYGKGYALDQVALLLEEWDIENALVHSGRSSALATGAPPGERGWPITLSHPNTPETPLTKVTLKNRAFSGSGLQKGRHIIDPRSGRPAEGAIAAWASTPEAASSDALSTAFMIMAADEIETYCATHPQVSGKVITKKIINGEFQEEILSFGNWEKLLS